MKKLIKMLGKRFHGLARKAEARYTELERMWKPIGITLSVLSGLRAAYRFAEGYGILTLPVAGFLALSAFLLLTVPVRGIRLLVLRGLALLVDVLFLSSLTVASLLLYNPQGIYPGAPVLMIVVWLWFFYFVLSDWRFKTTPGKQLFGFRLVSVGKEDSLSFCISFIHVFLGLAPLLIGGAFVSKAYGMNDSFSKFIAGSVVGFALLSVVPMSILILGGNQGIVDVVVGIVVKTDAEQVEPRTLRMALRRLPVICLSSLALGSLLTGLALLSAKELPFERGANQPQLSGLEDVAQIRVVVDRTAVARLWQSLPQGLRDPTSTIRYIQLLEASPNLFSFDAAKSRIPVPLNPEADLKRYGKMRVIQVSLAQSASSMAKLLIMQNLATTLAPSISLADRPKFVVLEIVTEYDFGLFRFTSGENMLFCMMRTEDRPVDFYAELSGGRFVQLGNSLDNIRWLLLGEVRWVDSERPYPNF